MGLVSRRSVLVGLLFASLLAMSVHYDAVAASHDPSPTVDELERAYAAHVGETFYTWTRVVERRPDALVVRTGSLVLTVDGSHPRAAPGDAVQVYGTLEPGYRVDPARIVVSKQGRLYRLYAVSGVAALLAGALFLRSWTVDVRRLVIEPRRSEDSG